MTVADLIDALTAFDPDNVVILTEPDGMGWDNIGKVYQDGQAVKITMDGSGLFQDS